MAFVPSLDQIVVGAGLFGAGSSVDRKAALETLYCGEKVGCGHVTLWLST